MAASIEEFPTGIRNGIIHGLGNKRGAEIVGAIDDQCRFLDISDLFTIFPICKAS